jgi:phospholipid/cholesterol/gamma-HCH transport system permease protein
VSRPGLAELMAEGWISETAAGERLEVEVGGGWTLDQVQHLDDDLQGVLARAGAAGVAAHISLARLERLDTAGAWLLHRLERDLDARGVRVEFAAVRGEHAALLEAVRRAAPVPPTPPARPDPLLRMLAEVGEGSIRAFEEGRRLISFFGQIAVALAAVVVRPGRLRMISLVHHLEHTGVNALPIVGLISFLIGVVLAYQGATQLRLFGAEIFTIDLLAISVLREIGVLLTAIVVAGRSGSAFTAQLGTMQVNEEIDAMRTLGLDPIEVLVLPRLLALMIALPLLAFFANIMALLGGGVMALVALEISPAQFVSRLDETMTLSTFLVGMVKAPVFAFLIAMVGCYEGMNATGSAESVGRQTTRSVVVGIFLVIVSDALFSIVFSMVGV